MILSRRSPVLFFKNSFPDQEPFSAQVPDAPSGWAALLSRLWIGVRNVSECRKQEFLVNFLVGLAEDGFVY